MKTSSITISLVLAAIAAIVILPVSSVAASSAIVATGILAVFVADYGRTIKPLSVQAEVIPFRAAHCVPNARCEAA